jgi:TetR/AcrR family fatty acid metabolism transcriptional regulator
LVARDGKASAARQDTDRYKAILRAAINVFAEKGYHGCRISDVARAAGVAHGLVYHYFEDKEQLLEAVFELGWGGFVARVREIAESAGPLEAKVRGIVELAFHAYQVDPNAVRVIILEIARSPAVDRERRGSSFTGALRLCEGMFAEAKGKGELKRELNPTLCSALLFGAIEMGLTAFLLGLIDSGTDRALERAMLQLTESFLQGVLPGKAEVRVEGSKALLRFGRPPTQ